jgi:hypothetical protein
MTRGESAVAIRLVPAIAAALSTQRSRAGAAAVDGRERLDVGPRGTRATGTRWQQPPPWPEPGAGRRARRWSSCAPRRCSRQRGSRPGCCSSSPQTCRERGMRLSEPSARTGRNRFLRYVRGWVTIAEGDVGPARQRPRGGLLATWQPDANASPTPYARTRASSTPREPPQHCRSYCSLATGRRCSTTRSGAWARLTCSMSAPGSSGSWRQCPVRSSGATAARPGRWRGSDQEATCWRSSAASEQRLFSPSPRCARHGRAGSSLPARCSRG